MAEGRMWGSKLAFILAAAGAAVGLGNIWGLPTQAGQAAGPPYRGTRVLALHPLCSRKRSRGFWTEFTSSRWGGNFLGFMIVIWNNFTLPIGGLLIAAFVADVWRVDQALDELLAENACFPAPALWGFLIRIVSPVAIAVILAMGVWPLFFG